MDPNKKTTETSRSESFPDPHRKPEPWSSVQIKRRFKLQTRHLLGTVGRLNSFWRTVFLSVLIGSTTGFLVYLIEKLVYRLLFLTLYNTAFKNHFVVIAIPMIGVLLTRYILSAGKVDNAGGTEEVVKSYHEFRGKISLRNALYKIPSYIATLGFGGSAGLEGVSTYIGGVISSLVDRTLGWLKIPYEEQRVMLLAGAGAGLSAMFKAPFTGAIFVLQVPYRSDIAPNALVPTLIASVSSYIVMVSLAGTKPLFQLAAKAQFHFKDFLSVLVIGLVCGVLTTLFIRIYRATKKWFLRGQERIGFRHVLGAFILGLTGYISTRAYGEALPLGPGYIFIQHLLTGNTPIEMAIVLFFLKAIAVIFTFSAGGIGGSFFPLLCLGAATGSVMAQIAGLEPYDFGVVMGMSAFLAAGYKTPLAAVVFIAEATHSSGYLIPGLIGTVVSYVISGSTSISTHQRDREDIHLSNRFHLPVKNAMIRNVVSVPENITLEEFREHFVVRHLHRIYPVTRESSEGHRVIGIFSLYDLDRFPVDNWPKTLISEAMITNVVTVTAEEPILSAIAKMNDRDLEFLPVIDNDRNRNLVGGLTRTDIFQGEWASLV